MKKKYYLVMQAEPGCDYSIHCGLSVIELNSSNRENAIEEAIGMPLDNSLEEIANYSTSEQEFEDLLHDEFAGELINNYLTNEEFEINKAFIFEVTSVIDLDGSILDKKEFLEKKKQKHKDKIKCRQKKKK